MELPQGECELNLFVAGVARGRWELAEVFGYRVGGRDVLGLARWSLRQRGRRKGISWR